MSDLAGAGTVQKAHVAEAVSFRLSLKGG